MIVCFKRYAVRLWCGLGVALMLVSATGCNLDRFRGDGFTGETKKWGEGLRPSGGDAEDHAGFSTKAREIESHLGS